MKRAGSSWNPVALALLAGVTGFAASLTAKDAFTVEWKEADAAGRRWTVEVGGIPPALLQKLASPESTVEWPRLLAVYAEQGDAFTDVTLPAMLGAYRIAPQRLRFEPQFPLEPGVRYRAVFRPAQLPDDAHAGADFVSAVHTLSAAPVKATTVVAKVYPSAAVLPENLLKFYLHFSAPMSRGGSYGHIRLLNAAGNPVELPFLEIDEELWNAEMTRLTLIIDPGRIKRGVRPLEEIGPALEEGRDFTLVIDRAWHDASGQPLRETFQHAFSVGPADREPPDPARWTISAPRPGTREPLVVDFGEPLDHALALRMLQVRTPDDEEAPGTASLAEHERRWRFIPQTDWSAGPHQLLVQTTIEDLAGNNIGKPFEVDLFEGVQRRLSRTSVRVPFTVQ